MELLLFSTSNYSKKQKGSASGVFWLCTAWQHLLISTYCLELMSFSSHTTQNEKAFITIISTPVKLKQTHNILYDDSYSTLNATSELVKGYYTLKSKM